MSNDFIRELFSQVEEKVFAEQNLKAAEVIRDLCIQNDLEIPEQLMVLQYFAGIDDNLIINKISALNTPLIEYAMHCLH